MNFIIAACILFVAGITNINANAPTSEVINKKHNHATPIILQGLAQTCSNVGTVVAAENKKEKQQGVLNVLGTLFSVAAQLSAQNNNQQTQVQQQQQPQLQQVGQTGAATQQQVDPNFAKKMCQVTCDLLNELEAETFYKSTSELPTTLAWIKSMETQEEKEDVVTLLLSSAGHAKQYLQDLFTAASTYLYNKFGQVALAMQAFVGYQQTQQAPQAPVVEKQAATDNTTKDIQQK